ncbi:MAG: hypothetical protein QHC67_01205 [Sphingobium sp.]|uniref:hypothetical protein n=1 Tax=Sphingobium sp. TaxID=1912891 RepID=UPI0029B89ED0|nr:hypothetical protein [Sphingobium sp.]MDX3908425.1 hypothetical protein [Sphingobium sp.]
MQLSFGGILTPFLGGPTQRINRLGTRWAMRFSMPPMAAELARRWVAALAQGVDRGAVMAIPQDIDVGDPGAPLLSASVTAGTTLPLKGMSAGYGVKAGQYLSIIHSGQRYVHIFGADANVSAGGTINASVWPMIRTGLFVNDVVEIAAPKIEGWLDAQFEYDILQLPYVQLPDFTITERA